MIRLEKTLQFSCEAMEIMKTLLPSTHPDLTAAYNNIGTLHMRLKQYDMASEQFKIGLRIHLMSLPQNHPDVRSNRLNIGAAYYMKQDYRQALAHYEKALEIYQRTLPATHKSILEISANIATARSQIEIYT